MSSNEIIKKEMFEATTIDENVYSALKNSIYPGAKDESIAMALAYCKARNLDPLQKPVHIVPMWIVDKKTGKGEMRDTVMPGIGLYRIQAQRSGAYAGQSDPEFGEDITEEIEKVKITYPKWCKIIVKKMMPNGEIVEFAAKEYWKENYATAGKDSQAPNAMWKKRPYAQLAKCTEAQALRKAFPDILDQSPTAEEMEGKHIYESDIHTSGSSKVDKLNKKIGLMIDAKPENESKEVKEEINTETGEVTEQTQKSVFSIAEIEKKIQEAKTVNELVEAVDLVNSLPSSQNEDKKALMGYYRIRQKEIN